MSQTIQRRRFVGGSIAAAAAWTLLPQTLRAQDATDTSDLRLATFRCDVTPPTGHSLCGGWIRPVEAVDDPLEAIGMVILGAGAPLVLCAVDWTGILNSLHLRWRQTLAEAAGTTADRVAVHCVHQHNAPFACLDAQRLVADQGDLPDIVDPEFMETSLNRVARAVAEALPTGRRITHVAAVSSEVERVAANRRVHRDDRGRVLAMRGSSCRDDQLRALPEGLIDPHARTIAFYNESTRIAACHYYAVHPMSYYGDGRVSSDFAGLARKAMQQDDADGTHLYFTGCAGNIAAGKYNDGTPPRRQQLTERLAAALSSNLTKLQPQPIRQLTWRSVDVRPEPNESLSAERLEQQISDRQGRVVDRNRPSFQLAWLQRVEQGMPITISSLAVNEIATMHLPGECFIQYQLAAQQLGGDRFVATAAYGDGGPWYIPVADEYPHGGYEVSVAFCAPSVDPVLREAMRQLLAGHS